MFKNKEKQGEYKKVETGTSGLSLASLYLMAILNLTSCNSKPHYLDVPIVDNTVEVSDTLITIDPNINPHQAKVIKDALFFSMQTYGKQLAIKVCLANEEQLKDMVKYSLDGSKDFTLAYVKDPGVIVINPLTIVKESDKKLRNTLKHEFVHAMQDGSYSYFKEPITIRGNGQWIGVQGMSMVVDLKGTPIRRDKDTTYIKCVEEAVAEYLASTAEEGYSVGSAQYAIMGSLMMKFTKEFGISREDIIQWHNNNGLLDFFGALINKKKEDLSTKDIVLVMDVFNNAWRSGKQGRFLELDDIKKLVDDSYATLLDMKQK